MKSTVQIKSVFGSLLFESECESIKEAVAEANLRGVDLRWANLYGADLRGVDLRGANLYGADLRGVDLYRANLRGVDLRGADLRGVDLYGANLRGVDLRGANLYGADLYGVDLRGANLYGVDLRGVDLRGANLRGANITDLDKARISIVPEGDIIGWKKCKNEIIVKVLIPKEAKRSNATGRKCRAEYVEVLELINLDEKRKKVEVAISNHDNKTEYRKGETVKCDKWDDERFNECSGGIHFFITKEEAIDYN